MRFEDGSRCPTEVCEIPSSRWLQKPLLRLDGSCAHYQGVSQLWGKVMADSYRLPRIFLPLVGIVGLSLVGFVGSPAFGAETVTYTYDVHGRLIKVVHSGTVNDAVTQNYSFDAADNRTNITVTGSPN
jgi:hypothetical protein